MRRAYAGPEGIELRLDYSAKEATLRARGRKGWVQAPHDKFPDVIAAQGHPMTDAQLAWLAAYSRKIADCVAGVVPPKDSWTASPSA